MREDNKLCGALFGLPKPQCSKRCDSFFIVPHVYTGYRVNYNAKQCALSIFTFHNETWNIWTHLFAALCVLVIGIYAFSNLLVDYTSMEKIVVFLNFLGAFIGMFGSAMYHCFACQCKDIHDCFLCCDIGGMYCTIATVLLSWSYFAFICHPQLRAMYVVASGCVWAVGLMIGWFSAHAKYGYPLIKYGTIASTSIGFVILIHTYVVVPKNEWEVWADYKYTLLTMFMGIIFYAIQFPEKYFRDVSHHFHFYSHALWHISCGGTAVIGCIQAIRVSKAAKEYICS